MRIIKQWLQVGGVTLGLLGAAPFAAADHDDDYRYADSIPAGSAVIADRGDCRGAYDGGRYCRTVEPPARRVEVHHYHHKPRWKKRHRRHHRHHHRRHHHRGEVKVVHHYHHRGGHAGPQYAPPPPPAAVPAPTYSYPPDTPVRYGAGAYTLRNEAVGGLIGAAVGGLVGAQFGGGNGKLATTAAGTLTGYFLGSHAGRNSHFR